MIEGKTVVAIIPARGGSRGIPRKNIAPLAGRPLIAWTIDAARRSRYIDRTVLSSEDEEIMRIARELGCDVPFVRPAELALDETPGIDPVLHALGALGDRYDLVVMLQPTSPLRTAKDIDGCLERCMARSAPACVSVTLPEKSPYWMYTVDGADHLVPVIPGALIQRRQELPVVYALNGAVYVADCRWLQNSRSFITAETVAYPMPRGRSSDIDTELDLSICELLMGRPGGSDR